MENKKIIVLNVHSISSVVTNSSEMIYIIDDNKTGAIIREILKPYIKMDHEEGNTSGNGGEVEFFENEDRELCIMVDWAMENTLGALKNIFGYKGEV